MTGKCPPPPAIASPYEDIPTGDAIRFMKSVLAWPFFYLADTLRSIVINLLTKEKLCDILPVQHVLTDVMLM